MIDGSLSISDFPPPLPVNAQLPSALWKKASSRSRALSRPPIAANSPAGSCCTIQVYWAAVPSTKPLPVAGVKPVTQLPSAARLAM